MNIKQRKKDHIELTVEEDVSYRKTTGFEKYDFVHDALPEVNLAGITTSTTLLGREFSFPLFISSMTGGHRESHSLNAMIAEFCQDHNLPFGVGSQRVMLENPEEADSFKVVRKKAPDAFIAANIGGAQLVGGLPADQVKILIDTIRADALIVHLNPLQELMQPEGDHNFDGVEEGIAVLTANAGVPVIVKETGAGISEGVARRLLSVVVDVIDVSGAGGTSWAKVEYLRKQKAEGQPARIEDPFSDWGIPTAVCIEDINRLRETFRFEMIASGGIRTSFDMIKALALGADFTATAQPVVASLKSGYRAELERIYRNWTGTFSKALALLGCRSPRDLHPGLLRKV